MVIRHRDRYMPTFHQASIQPNVSLANLDAVELNINNAFEINFSNIDQYNAFKGRLALSDLFRSDGVGTASNRFVVRQENRYLPERWLFKGKISFKSIGDNTFRASLNLKLNPSRFLNHFFNSHPFEGDFNLPEQIMSREALQVIEANPMLENSMRGIDFADNLIPKQYYRRARPVVGVFDAYLTKVTELIRENLENALGQELPQASYEFRTHLRDWYLKSAEIYWEYAVSDAISYVNGLRSFLLPLFNDAEVAEYVLRRDQVDNSPETTFAIHRNSPSLKMNLGSNKIKLTIYSKTFDRVRLEVSYKKNVRTLIAGRVRASDFSQEISGVVDLLNLTVTDARNRLNRVFRTMPDTDFSERSDFRTLTDFLSGTALALTQVRIGDDLQRIFSLLVSNRAYEARTGSPENDFCIAMQQEGIFRLANGSRQARGFKRYSLEPRYIHLVENFINSMPLSSSS
jgi:hypothetical protein